MRLVFICLVVLVASCKSVQVATICPEIDSIKTVTIHDTIGFEIPSVETLRLFFACDSTNKVVLLEAENLSLIIDSLKQNKEVIVRWKTQVVTNEVRIISKPKVYVSKPIVVKKVHWLNWPFLILNILFLFSNIFLIYKILKHWK